MLFVLIESDWNLKQINEEWANRHMMSINRIRLEFKEEGHDNMFQKINKVLIESDWNLKADVQI